MSKVIKINQPALRIDLTADEAEVLMVIFENVGGSPRGARGVIDSLLKQMENLGFKPTAYMRQRFPVGPGMIMFQD